MLPSPLSAIVGVPTFPFLCATQTLHVQQCNCRCGALAAPECMSEVMHLQNPAHGKSGLRGRGHDISCPYKGKKNPRTDLKVVQKLLRHANSRITLDLYAQAGMPETRLAQSKVVNMVLEKKSAVA